MAPRKSEREIKRIPVRRAIIWIVDATLAGLIGWLIQRFLG